MEEAGKEIAYQAAVEGIVLLENDGCLPLNPGKIALYGAGAKMTIKGGTGSQSMDESNVDDTWNSDDVQPEPSTTDKLKHLAIPVGIVGVVLAAVILVVIRRKKKKAGMDDEIL